MPSDPLTKIVGTTGTYHLGSIDIPSSSRYSRIASSSGWKYVLVSGDNFVNTYRADAASLPPMSRVPNWPDGTNQLTLFDPTKFWAMLTMVEVNDISPWW